VTPAGPVADTESLRERPHVPMTGLMRSDSPSTMPNLALWARALVLLTAMSMATPALGQEDDDPPPAPTAEPADTAEPKEEPAATPTAEPAAEPVAEPKEAKDEEHPAEEVARGEKKEVSIAMTAKAGAVAAGPPTDKPPPATDKPPPAAETSSGSSIIPAAVTLSLAGAGVIVGAVFGGLALKSKGEFEDTPTQDLFDETERNALIADMSFGVALTFGVTGLVLLLTDSGSEEAPKDEKKPEEKKATFRFAPYGGPSGAGAVGVVTF
jgi:hypothetical protein